MGGGPRAASARAEARYLVDVPARVTLAPDSAARLFVALYP
jgi:hypothetical protein